MALTKPEHLRVLKRVGIMHEEMATVLAYFYAGAVAYSGKHPQNINNEIRNAVTHMARALTENSLALAENELAAAVRHMERFKRDCLKVVVIYAGRDASRMIRQVEQMYGKLNPQQHLECADITRAKLDILRREVFGDSETSDRWEALLLRIERLRTTLIENYNLLHPKFYGVPWIIARTFAWFCRIAGVMLGGILAAAAAAAALPDKQAFGIKAQEIIGIAVKVLFGGS